MHNHKYQFGQIKFNFEPYETSADGVVIYAMVEYVYLYCPCGGSVKKERVTP